MSRGPTTHAYMRVALTPPPPVRWGDRLRPCTHIRARAMDRATISSLTGSLSFIIWLFAQSPQLYENYRRGSVDGLSPVFLIQWMLGDFTNLIGSVLTQQLPFQIAVATYFCCVDACIMVQYVYYWSKARRSQSKLKRGSRPRLNSLTGMTASFTHGYPANPYSMLSETSELLGPRSSLRIHHHRSASLQKRSLSQSQNLQQTAFATAPSTRRSRSRIALSRSESSDSTGYEYGYDSQSSNYRALSYAALSVAQLAQQAARRRDALAGLLPESDIDNYFSFPSADQRRSQSRGTPPSSRSRSRTNSLTQGSTSTSAPLEPAKQAGLRRSRQRVRRVGGVPGEFVPSALSPTRESGRDADEAESDRDHNTESSLPSAMLDSTSSLGSLDLDPEMHDSVDSLVEPRGRDMTRTANRIESSNLLTTPKSGEAQLPSGNATPTSSSGSSDGTAKVAQQQPVSSSDEEDDDTADMHKSLSALPPLGSKRSMERSRSSRSVSKRLRGNRTGAKSPSSVRRSIGMVLLGVMMLASLPGDAASIPRAESSIGAASLLLQVGSWQRLVGRMSAWTCTVLYLTSRLPQIWENYIRRSVRGLSILLFMAAFMGNLLYTISVLSNPEAVGPGRRGYLQESLPFLLGSGGTLVFDLIIIGQWWMWSDNDEANDEEPANKQPRPTTRPRRRAERKASSRNGTSASTERSRASGMTQSLLLPPKSTFHTADTR